MLMHEESGTESTTSPAATGAVTKRPRPPPRCDGFTASGAEAKPGRCCRLSSKSVHERSRCSSSPSDEHAVASGARHALRGVAGGERRRECSATSIIWAPVSGASLSANNTFTGENTFNADITLGTTTTHVVDGSGNRKYALNSHNHSGTYAELANSTTLAGYNYGTIDGSVVNFNAPTKFWGRVEFNEKTPSYRIGAVTGESSSVMFSSGASANTRLEVDDGNHYAPGY